ncbi:odorant receptor 49a-like isoform X1 [Solenopsis invicta]|uniref:odorant receptor 49a-like isoform X1 n=1 Tax=Solenopsis invicta TaxID=13686 RepID=UPI00193DFD0E|nr:odorant receptor 49a-like isoform X1 [Solenopsis invicta]XP_039312463.1 odorant receptor 49a-like isoform X1 [Solenopsis invicta]
MIDKQLQAYRKYQRFIKTILTVTGCWYMPTKSGKSTYYWPICVLLLMNVYLILILHTTYVFRHNLVNMMKMTGVAISSISAIIKVTTFMVHRKSLKNCHRILSDFFEEELTQNKQIRRIMFSSLRATYTMAYAYFIILISLISGYAAPPIISMIRDLCHLRLTTNYNLPVGRGHLYFWTVPDNLLYHLHFFYELTQTSLSSMLACAIESVFGFYTYLFASTVRVMIFRLTNPLPTDKFSDVLKMCIKKHQKLLKCRDTLERVFGPIVLWHVVSNSILLCSLIYETVNMEFSFANITVIVPYSSIKLLQMFIYAQYGTVLTNASDDFRKGIYFSEWPNSDLDCHVKTNVILMLMQKPMTIYAIFSPVEMIMFTNVINTTMSYFFLLRSKDG